MNPQHPSDAAPSPIPPSPSHLARAKTDGRGGHGGATPEGAGPTARVGYGPLLLVLSKLPCGGDHFPGQSGGQGNGQGRGGKHSGTAQRTDCGHRSGAQAASRHPMNLPRELWGVCPSVRPLCSSQPSGLAGHSPPAFSPWICFDVVLHFSFFCLFQTLPFLSKFLAHLLAHVLDSFPSPFIFPPSLHSQRCPAFLFISCSRSHCVFFVVLTTTTFLGIRKGKSQRYVAARLSLAIGADQPGFLIPRANPAFPRRSALAPRSLPQHIPGAARHVPAPPAAFAHLHCEDGGGKAQGRNLPRIWLCAGPGFVPKNQGRREQMLQVGWAIAAVASHKR